MSSDLDTIPLRPLDLTVGGLTVSLLGARDHDALLAATSNRGHLPFGLVLWESAVVLAEILVERRETLADHSVLELGAGLGLPGLIAVRLGASVVQSDVDPLTLQVAARNAVLNGVSARIAHRQGDWRAWTDPQRFDVVIGADILYDRDDHAYIAKTLVAAVKPDGRVLLADPGRPTTPEFLRRLAAEGWSVRTTGHETADISRPNWTVDVMLIEAWRP